MDKVDGSNWYNWPAYVLSVVASFFACLALGFSDLKDDTSVAVAGFVAIGILLMSVLNTPLTLLVKWKVASHVFYAYHVAVHCLVIATTVIGAVGDILSPLTENLGFRMASLSAFSASMPAPFGGWYLATERAFKERGMQPSPTPSTRGGRRGSEPMTAVCRHTPTADRAPG